jgi:hypothetical protein
MAPAVVVRRCACLAAALVALIAPSRAWATLALDDPSDTALALAYAKCVARFYVANLGGIVDQLQSSSSHPSNDLVGANGVPPAQPPAFGDLYPGFADHWRIDAPASLFDYGPGESTARNLEDLGRHPDRVL